MFAYEQLKRSWYMYFFLTPVAEMVVGLADLAFIDGLWRDWSPGYDAADDIAHAKGALRDPANLAAAVGYYSAMLGATAPAAPPPIAPQPTLLLHGDRDGASAAESYDGAEAFLSSGSVVETIGGAGHFPHLEKPTGTNQLIVEWLTARR
jgi:pimeloyl-ACP methyl ester carboxylesterase